MKVEQSEFLLLKDLADEVFNSDTFHPKHRRTIKKVGADGQTVYDAFYERGTRAAILVAMLVAAEAGLDPVTAVAQEGADVPAGPAKPSGDDEFTAAAIEGAGDPVKPDFNTLKKQYGKTDKQIAEGMGDARTFPSGEKVPPGFPDRPLNEDIAKQEEELLPGRMTYTAPTGQPEPIPAAPLVLAKAPKKKRVRDRKKKPVGFVKSEPQPGFKVGDTVTGAVDATVLDPDDALDQKLKGNG